MDVASATASAQTVATTSKSKLAGNFDTFLKLLTQQLQHQDPTKPMDTAEFTQQLVQYSQVEQQISTNSNLETMLNLQRASAGAASLGYLGKSVVTQGNASSLANGTANWTYQLPSNATEVQVLVSNAKGTIVYNGPGELNAGAHPFVWNGKNQNGAAQPDGVYKIEVKAKGADGQTITPTLTSSGIVSEADLSTTNPMLKIGLRSVALADVIAIKAQEHSTRI